MTRRKRFLWIVAAVCLGTLGGGCGTTGSKPTLYPEVRFHVEPTGGSTFTVDEFVVGLASSPAVTVRHTFPPGTVFTATSGFDFYFENAAPPYTGSFSLVSGGNIDVTLTVSDKLYDDVSTSGVGTTAAVTSSQQPMPTPIAPTQEVRFDVCVPFLTPGTCFTQGDSGLFGKAFSGTLGDVYQTHGLNGSTPSIYFLEGAQENASAVFRLVQTGPMFVAQLFINGTLRQTHANTQDVIIRQDL
jgi:hypothetical protein